MLKYILWLTSCLVLTLHLQAQLPPEEKKERLIFPLRQAQTWCEEGRNALLERDTSKARQTFERVLHCEFSTSDAYMGERTLDYQRTQAMMGMREWSVQTQRWDSALVWETRYFEAFTAYNPDQGRAYQARHARLMAEYYQRSGASEKAIEALAPYAFLLGRDEGVDKEMVGYLADLLRTKYPPKVWRKAMRKIAQEIYLEEEAGAMQGRFYLQILDNSLYFPSSGKAARMGGEGEQRAYYTQIFRNSYFYYCLQNAKRSE